MAQAVARKYADLEREQEDRPASGRVARQRGEPADERALVAVVDVRMAAGKATRRREHRHPQHHRERGERCRRGRRPRGGARPGECRHHPQRRQAGQGAGHESPRPGPVREVQPDHLHEVEGQRRGQQRHRSATHPSSRARRQGERQQRRGDRGEQVTRRAHDHLGEQRVLGAPGEGRRHPHQPEQGRPGRRRDHRAPAHQERRQQRSGDAGRAPRPGPGGTRPGPGAPPPPEPR